MIALKWKIIFLMTILCYAFPVAADVKVSNLRDYNFGLYPGSGGLRDDKNICINVLPRGRYQIVMFGDGSGGRFEVFNGVNSIPYRVFYNDRPQSIGANRVRPSRVLSRQRGASDQLDCTNGLNANIRIDLRARDLTRASPGRYQGVLTMTVSPE